MVGIGTDIVEIERIKKALLRHPERFPERLLSHEELAVYRQHKRPVEYLAGRFAAKEAVLKAFGTGLRDCSFTDISIINEISGKPRAMVKGNLLILANHIDMENIHITISHSKDYAVAFCIIE